MAVNPLHESSLPSLPQHQHSAMTGLLVIFSALGGTTGSLITGYVFGNFNGHFAFYLTLVPIALVLVTLYLFKRQVDRRSDDGLAVLI